MRDERLVGRRMAPIAAIVLSGVLAACGGPSRVSRLYDTLSKELLDGSLAVRDLGEGTNSVEVHLRASETNGAADLVARYHDLVTVTVGNFPYPMPTNPAPSTPAGCGASSSTGAIEVSGLRASIGPVSSTVRSGEDSKTTVTITNTSSTTVSFDAGTPNPAILMRPGTNEVVGNYDGAIGGTGTLATLAPGQTFTVDAPIGTASCDPTLGFAVAPGTYDLVVQLDVRIGQSNFRDKLMSAPTPITIAA